MKWLLAALALALPAGAQTVTQRAACQVVTQQDAESVLGPKAMQHSRPGSCAWNLPDSPLVFVVVVDYSPNAAQSLSIPRQAVPKMGGLIREEPAIGPGAFSATIKGVQNIYLIKGKAVASVSITNDNKGILGDYLDKLRPIAKRVASRL